MKKRNKIIVSIVGIIIVLLALLGITYAYYLTRIQGNTNTNSISITTAKLELVYDDDKEEIIEGNGALVPDSDDPIGTKTFIVTNNGNDSSYVVIIDNVSTKIAGTNTDTTFLSNDFRYTLTCTKSDGTKCNDVSDLTTFPIKGGILVSNDIKAEDVHTYTLTMWYIDTGIDQSDDMGKTYQARVNIADVNQMENPFTTGVTATDNTSLAYNIINNAKENKNGTTFVNTSLTNVAEFTSIFSYGTKKSTYYPSKNSNLTTSNTYTYASDYVIDSSGNFTLINPKTLVYSDNYELLKGKYIVSPSGATSEENSSSLSKIYEVSPTEVTSTEFNYVSVNKYISNEKVLSITHDDFGISYYFRGGVEDNYLNFADMCWRIVRIVGDGSIKLILEDHDNTCESANGNWNIPTTLGGTTITGNIGYTLYSVNELTASDGITKNTSAKTVIDYLHGKTNSDKSMATAFKNFQGGFTTEEIKKLKSGGWCYSDAGYLKGDSSSHNIYTLLTDAQKIDNKILSLNIYYDSYKRLMGKSLDGYKPTLKCTGIMMENFEDNNDTPMYVSSLTADEIVYAGGKYLTDNQAYYLLNDYQRIRNLYFWILTPSYFEENYDSAFGFSYSGKLRSGSISANISFRPSITLKSETKITSGDGTRLNPYIIS